MATESTEHTEREFSHEIHERMITFGSSGRRTALPCSHPGQAAPRAAQIRDPGKKVGHSGKRRRGFWIPGLASLARNDEKENRSPGMTFTTTVIPEARAHHPQSSRKPAQRAIRDPGKRQGKAANVDVISGFRVSLRSPGMTDRGLSGFRDHPCSRAASPIRNAEDAKAQSTQRE